METLTSKEYAKVISETADEKELREAYEANLIAAGRDAPYQIEDAYKQGKINASKHFMDTYVQVKEHFKDLAGLSWEAIEQMIAEAVDYILEEL